MACKEEIGEIRLEHETCLEDVGFSEPCHDCNSKKRKLCIHSQYGSRKKILLMKQQESISSPTTVLFQSPTSTIPSPSLPPYFRSYLAPIFSDPTPATAALFRSKTHIPRASNSCMKWKKGMKVDRTGLFPCMEIGKHGKVKEQLQNEISAVETEVSDGVRAAVVVEHEDGRKCSEKKGDKEERQHGTFHIKCECGRVYCWSIN